MCTLFNDVAHGAFEALRVCKYYPISDTGFVLYGSMTYIKLDHDYSEGRVSYSTSGSGFSVEPGVVSVLMSIFP